MSARCWIVPHTHWDREWYLSFQDFRWKLVAAVDAVLDTLESDPRFPHFMLDGQTVLLDDYLALRPERRQAIRSLASAGRLSVGPWYVQPDDILVTGEALIRNLERGMAQAREYGRPMMVGYLPDSFGHIGSLPSILQGFGMSSASMMRGPGPSLDKVFFEWIARDGSRVTVAYLIDGYGNGAELPMDPASIGAVLEELARRQAGALLPGVPLLVMNGIDHRSIDAPLPGVLAEAGMQDDARIGSLEEYVEAARVSLRAQTEAVPRWQGELRSVYRCPITVGCTSARHWIKREDQEISTLLERRAEPLAALASLLGAPYPSAALDLSWRYLLLNQPHDSICGCSIDSVHDDMRYRYAQARALAKNAAQDAARIIAGRTPGPARAAESHVAVNAAPARVCRALGFQVPEVPDRAVLQDVEGRLFPVQAVSASGEPALFFDEKFRPAQLRLAMGLVRNGEIMSYRIHDARTSWESDSVLRVDLALAEGGSSGFDWNGWIAATLPLLSRRGLASIHAVGMRVGRKTVLFSAPVPAFGARAFSLRSLRPQETPPAAEELSAGRDFIENEHYRVQVQGDGSIDLLDRKSARLYRGLARLVDTGDRGDEYSYDPPERDKVVERPLRRLPTGRSVRTSLVERGPVRATLRIEAAYRVPASLTTDRRGRSGRTVELRTVRLVSLAAGATRVEIRTEVNNTALDHRLRLHFPLPGICRETAAGGTFEVVRRPSEPETLPERPSRGGVASDLSQELPTGMHPFTGFVAAPWSDPFSGAGGTLAVFSRGSRELEVVPRGRPNATEARGAGSELAVTLFRAVGWLSRADLVFRTGHAGMDTPTPGAQEQGTSVFEHAVACGGPGMTDSELLREWEDYRCPAEVVTVPAAPGEAVPGESGAESSLLDIEGQGITFSSLTRTQSGFLRLRFFEQEGKGGSVTLRFAHPAQTARKVRLDGTPLGEVVISGDRRSGVVSVAPCEIVTVEIEPAP